MTPCSLINVHQSCQMFQWKIKQKWCIREMIKLSFGNLTNEINVSSTSKIEAVILSKRWWKITWHHISKDRTLHTHCFDDTSSSKGTFWLKIPFLHAGDRVNDKNRPLRGLRKISGRFNDNDNVPICTHWIGSWMGPESGVEFAKTREISFLAGKRITISQLSNRLPTHYTYWAISVA
jgi:hypothetical protein